MTDRRPSRLIRAAIVHGLLVVLLAGCGAGVVFNGPAQTAPGAGAAIQTPLPAGAAGSEGSSPAGAASIAPGSTTAGGPAAGPGGPAAASSSPAASAGAPSPSAGSTTPPIAPVTASYSPGHLGLKLSAIGGTFNSPLFVGNAGDGSGRLYVVEQGGRIRILSGSTIASTPFLDIHSLVSCCGEQGLLGLAFHPSYKSNGRFFVDYTDVNGDTIIAEYRRSSSNSNQASTSGRILLKIGQPYSNHNGGMLAFGPDGYLYIAMGDGGSGGDPQNRAQNKSSLLGKLLRIDVNHRSGSLPYGIPSTNPFVGRTGDDRIWSYGLRNPWRFSFDRATGNLWIGDVGQSRYEEIDRATRKSGGGRAVNFGWRILEGRACFDPATGCDTSGKASPLAVYDHGQGCAVVGGYVYRGTAYRAMTGAYLFGDNCSGRIWAVTAAGSSSQTPRLLLDTNLAISSFGEGENGALYLTDLIGGHVYRLLGSSR